MLQPQCPSPSVLLIIVYFPRGQLAEGETVFVQGGAGGVGAAAIQLASRNGAEVFSTISGTERIAKMKDLGLTKAIDHRLTDVHDAIMNLTDNRGVDLAIDPIGSTLRTSLSVLWPGGRLVFVGNAGRSSLEVYLWQALQANKTLIGVFMGTELDKPDVHASVAHMLNRAAAGELEVLIDRTFSLANVAEAHAYAENNPVLGRVILHP